MFLGLAADRDLFEKSLLAWCIRNPDEFSHVAAQIRAKHFQDLYATNVWPHLLEVWERHEEWPTEGEAIHLVSQRMRGNPMLPPLLAYVKELYTIPISGVTGEEVKRWVIQRELQDLSARLASFSVGVQNKSTNDFALELEQLRTQFEMSMNLAEDEEEGEDYDPLSDSTIDSLEDDMEEDWGAAPLATGFVRLDRKLRDGGIRPQGVLILGPTGGGKSTFAMCVALYNTTQGKRGIYLSFDDHKGDLRERAHCNILCAEIEFENERRRGTLPRIQSELKATIKEQYPGRLIFKNLDAEQYGPSDILRIIDRIQRKLAVEDRKKGVPEELQGNIDYVILDTADQVRGEKGGYKDAWYDVPKTHQILNLIPKRFKCVLFSIVQTGQQTVGAAQITERDVGEAFGKTKPYKLILGVAQTHYQYQSDTTVSITESLIRDNIEHLHNYCIDRDRDTKWKPFFLCVSKNTRGSSLHGQANKVKIPMLVNYGSCRIIENFMESEVGFSTPMQTQREELIASQGSEISINRKRKVKVNHNDSPPPRPGN